MWNPVITVDQERAIDILGHVADTFPEENAAETALRLGAGRPLCPTGLISRSAEHAVRMESACDAMKAPWLDGPSGDQPASLLAAFTVIRNRRSLHVHREYKTPASKQGNAGG